MLGYVVEFCDGRCVQHVLDHSLLLATNSHAATAQLLLSRQEALVGIPIECALFGLLEKILINFQGALL